MDCFVIKIIPKFKNVNNKTLISIFKVSMQENVEMESYMNLEWCVRQICIIVISMLN